jgi:hypothetical protein
VDDHADEFDAGIRGVGDGFAVREAAAVGGEVEFVGAEFGDRGAVDDEAEDALEDPLAADLAGAEIGLLGDIGPATAVVGDPEEADAPVFGSDVAVGDGAHALDGVGFGVVLGGAERDPAGTGDAVEMGGDDEPVPRAIVESGGQDQEAFVFEADGHAAILLEWRPRSARKETVEKGSS